MFDRMLSLVVALSLALLVWLYARSRDQEVLDNVPVPVQVTLEREQAQHYQLEVTGPSHVMVSFTGPPLRIRELQGMLQRNELQIPVTFAVPAEHLRESRYTDSILVESADMHTPPGVTAIMIEGRNHVSLTLHRLVERRLPVRFDAVNNESAGTVVLSRRRSWCVGRRKCWTELASLLPSQRNCRRGRHRAEACFAFLWYKNWKADPCK